MRRWAVGSLWWSRACGGFPPSRSRVSLVFSPSATRDLQSIADYTLETWGAEQEALYLKGLWRKPEEIRACPEMHRFRDDLGLDCRSARHGKHVNFFEVEQNAIQVIRILHGAMDFNSYLDLGPA